MELLQPGQSIVVAQTTAYALPPQVVFLHASVAMELSLDNSNWVAVTATTTGLNVGALFVRCTSSTTCTVIVKRFN